MIVEVGESQSWAIRKYDFQTQLQVQEFCSLGLHYNFVISETGFSPGPSSTEGDRPPTNPAIRVQFPSGADGHFFCAVAEKCATPIYLNHSLQ